MPRTGHDEQVWDRETGANYQTLRKHSGSVFVVRPAKVETDASGLALGQCVLTGGVQPLSEDCCCAKVIVQSHAALRGSSFTPMQGDGRAFLWDLRSGQPVMSLLDSGGPVFCGDLVEEQGLIITAGGSGHARVFDVRTGSCLLDMREHTDSVWALSYHSLSRRLVTASVDCSLKVSRMSLSSLPHGLDSASFVYSTRVSCTGLGLLQWRLPFDARLPLGAGRCAHQRRGACCEWRHRRLDVRVVIPRLPADFGAGATLYSECGGVESAGTSSVRASHPSIRH